jgi:hypothetical protein
MICFSFIFNLGGIYMSSKLLNPYPYGSKEYIARKLELNAQYGMCGGFIMKRTSFGTEQEKSKQVQETEDRKENI